MSLISRCEVQNVTMITHLNLIIDWIDKYAHSLLVFSTNSDGIMRDYYKYPKQLYPTCWTQCPDLQGSIDRRGRQGENYSQIGLGKQRTKRIGAHCSHLM